MIVKANHISLCLILTGALFSSCSKKAITDFSFNKTEYSAGETVIIDNTSKDISTYRWIFKQPSGQTIKYSDANPKIKLNPCALDGEYSLTLQGAPQKGAPSSITRTFTVKTVRGYLYIYNFSNLKDTIEIKDDGQSIGKLYNGNNPLQIRIATGQRHLTAGNGSKLSMELGEDELYPWNLGE